MKTTVILSVLSAALLTAQGDSLRFTSGVVSNFYDVTLTLQGPTNQTCQVERLDRTDQTWDSVGTVRLNSSGAGTFNSTLVDGMYGCFRAKTTNNTYYSTNAFGAVAGYLYPKWCMIGNPFAETSISNIITDAADGTMVYKWIGTNYIISTYYDPDTWDPEISVSRGEGAIVRTPTNVSSQRYIVSGLFDTNAITKSIPSGSSILCSPLYELIVPANWQVDELNTNRLGGYSLLPVQSPGYSPQCTINRMINTNGDYQTYTLTTNNVWQTGGSNTVVPLNLTEGFWINKPASATWTVNLSIW